MRDGRARRAPRPHAARGRAAVAAGQFRGQLATFRAAIPKTAAPASAGDREAFLAEIEARNYRPASLRTYRKALERLAALDLLDAPSAGELLAGLERAAPELAPASRAAYLAAARAFEKWRAAREKRPRRLDDAGVRLDDPAPRPIGRAELARLEAAARKAEPRCRLLFRLLRGAPIRIGDAVRLRWRDVILERGNEAIVVRAPKGRADRTVPVLRGELLDELRRAARRAVGPDAYVLRGAPFESDALLRPISYSAALRDWRELCAVARVKATPHQLRDTLATELAHAGVNVYTLRRHFGWRRLETADRYVEATAGDVRAALERVQNERD